MYTDEDLDNAVENGIFTKKSVEVFRAYILDRNNTHVADEENFRLIASFNDIFVVIACALLLFSSAWVAQNLHPIFAAMIVSLLSWKLADFFVLKRKMALPAIVLLISFVGGAFTTMILMFEELSESSFMLSTLVTSIAAWFHWKRFKVPITVAAGAAAMVIFVISLFISVFPLLKDYLILFMFTGGVVIFLIAMYWDSEDLQRVTGKSDVAFWLHLTSAPLIVHPIFSSLGILDGNENLVSLAAIVGLYILLTLISVAIDRRAFMVSSLIYVLVALTQLLNTYGFASDSFAYVGVFIGFSLLLLSGFWHKARSQIVVHLPSNIRSRVPLIVEGSNKNNREG